MKNVMPPNIAWFIGEAQLLYQLALKIGIKVVELQS